VTSLSALWCSIASFGVSAAWSVALSDSNSVHQRDLSTLVESCSVLSVAFEVDKLIYKSLWIFDSS